MIRVLLESALTAEQLAHHRNLGIYRHGSRKTTKFSDHAFGGSPQKRTVVLPLQPPESKLEKPIHKHLAKLGYAPHDYHAGLAKDKHGREVRIGKILAKAGKHKELAKFNSDPARAQAQANKGLQVVISRKPSDVIGQSTNCSWGSCMGPHHENYKYVSQDVKHGTHIAYLTKKGDDKARKPLARISLKPHGVSFTLGRHGVKEIRSKDKPHQQGLFAKTRRGKSTILVPEDNTYGNAPSSFHKTVSSWAKAKFPAKAVGYTKSRSLYDDSGKRLHFGSKRVVGKLIRSLKTDKIWQGGSQEAQENIGTAAAQVASPKQAMHLATHYSVPYDIQQSVISSAKFKKLDIKELVKARNYRAAHRLISNSHANKGEFATMQIIHNTDAHPLYRAVAYDHLRLSNDTKRRRLNRSLVHTAMAGKLPVKGDAHLVAGKGYNKDIAYSWARRHGTSFNPHATDASGALTSPANLSHALDLATKGSRGHQELVHGVSFSPKNKKLYSKYVDYVAAKGLHLKGNKYNNRETWTDATPIQQSKLARTYKHKPTPNDHGDSYTGPHLWKASKSAVKTMITNNAHAAPFLAGLVRIHAKYPRGAESVEIAKHGLKVLADVGHTRDIAYELRGSMKSNGDPLVRKIYKYMKSHKAYKQHLQ